MRATSSAASRRSPAQRGVAHDHGLLRCRLLEIPGRLVDEARFCDLTMVPLKEADAAEQDIAEQLVFESGRPILIFPDDSKRDVARVLEATSPWHGISAVPPRGRSRMPCPCSSKRNKYGSSPWSTTSRSTNRSRWRSWQRTWRDMAWKSFPKTSSPTDEQSATCSRHMSPTTRSTCLSWGRTVTRGSGNSFSAVRPGAFSTARRRWVLLSH